jgi:serine/tyrosine/threonine adenylyltransferase
LITPTQKILVAVVNLLPFEAMRFNNTYKTLPDQFYSPSSAAHFPAPKLIKFNHELSQKLGLDLSSKSNDELAKIFSGEITLDGSEPISLAYAGHQFGHFVEQLGDGRAMLLGEILDPHGKRFDVQLKGSGRTRFSRNGDGKSAMGPVIREYLLSEAMYHLGVPTTRALAAVATGETVLRETPRPGAVFTRIASSHLRIGTFQFIAARNDLTALKALLDYSIARHYPELMNQPKSALLFLQKVIEVQIKLVTHWMSLGFIHGVMNTDNMSISGETIDYGPCAFMDHFNYNQVYSFIDRNGRYSYNNQGKIVQWNLCRLAECLIPFIDSDEKVAIERLNHELSLIPKRFEKELNERIAAKLGFQYQDSDDEIIQSWFEYLQSENQDFTLGFRKLSDVIEGNDQSFFQATDSFKKFEQVWRKRLTETSKLKQQMDRINPLFIPRNHQVEKAIADAVTGNYSSFEQLNAILSRPFDEQLEFSPYALPPREEEKIQNTFCGT